MSGHKRIIETAVVLLTTVLVFSRGYAEQRFQKQMETLLEEYETGEAQTDNLQLTNLRVNYIPDPVGIDVQDITFSWELAYQDPPVRRELQAERNGQKEHVAEDNQLAYRITVTDEAGKIVWNSGIIKGGQTTQISYTGEKLQDLTAYTYTVTSFTEKGCRQGRGSFETACLNTAPFAGAEFITMPETEEVYED